MTNYGLWLFCKRKKLGISRFELSKRSGVPESSISNWENDGRDPAMNRFDQALRAIGYKIAIVPIEEEASPNEACKRED